MKTGRFCQWHKLIECSLTCLVVVFIQYLHTVTFIIKFMGWVISRGRTVVLFLFILLLFWKFTKIYFLFDYMCTIIYKLYTFAMSMQPVHVFHDIHACLETFYCDVLSLDFSIAYVKVSKSFFSLLLICEFIVNSKRFSPISSSKLVFYKLMLPCMFFNTTWNFKIITKCSCILQEHFRP